MSSGQSSATPARQDGDACRLYFDEAWIVEHYCSAYGHGTRTDAVTGRILPNAVRPSKPLGDAK